MIENLIAWILRAVSFGTIIMYGCMGETITEKSGNLNLGVPGIMYLGGFAGFAGAYYYEELTAKPNAVLWHFDCSRMRIFGGRVRRAHFQLFDDYTASQSKCDRSCADDVRHGGSPISLAL